MNTSGHDIHLLADNYATHKHPKVQKWLARHARFHVYFTPTGSSWLNMVERFFRDLTQNQLRRGIFGDVEELIMAIGEYIDKHNDNPKPFVWTAKATDIIEKVKRARKRSILLNLLAALHYTRSEIESARPYGYAAILATIYNIVGLLIFSGLGREDYADLSDHPV